ncbi:MAG: protein-glutamate O-methyltransferase CheR [Calditerrivibrio sp.]|nr:protein-glutamate O-methyltransferase CheR [Calditerrivibrio sp.]
MLDIYKEQLSPKQFEVLRNFIESHCGIKMPDTKKIMLESRIRKRLRALGISSFREYLDYVFNSKEGEDEVINLIDVVTTNKTEFFRENDHFVFLQEKALPYLIEKLGRISLLKVWSAACSSGEEPYTILITLSEFCEKNDMILDFQVLGTDISTAVLKKAKEAVYPMQSVSTIPLTLLKKYFLRSKDPSKQLVKVIKPLREKLILKRLNFMDKIYDIEGKFHIIFCRNALIYFSKTDQHEIVRKLTNYLIDGGFLFLGHSETIQDGSLPLKRVGPSTYIKWSYYEKN